MNFIWKKSVLTDVELNWQSFLVLKLFWLFKIKHTYDLFSDEWKLVSKLMKDFGNMTFDFIINLFNALASTWHGFFVFFLRDHFSWQ